jgi:hypothetical protein
MKMSAAEPKLDPVPPPVGPPAKLIVVGCVPQKRQFEIGSFDVDDDDDGGEFEWKDDDDVFGSDRPAKRQCHNALLSSAAGLDPGDDAAAVAPTTAAPDDDVPIANDSCGPALTVPCADDSAIVGPLDTLSAAEERAIQILNEKKNKKFKGKSDGEMKKIRSSNILSKSHSPTKETTIDRIYSYLQQNEDSADLADWIVMPDRFITRQSRLIVLTAGPRNE